MEEYTNPILQKLCADALISISDEDSDGELSFHEFMKCLNPGVYQDQSPYSKSQIVNIRRLNHFFQANLIRGSLLGRRVLFNVETQWYQRKVKNQTGVMVILWFLFWVMGMAACLTEIYRWHKLLLTLSKASFIGNQYYFVYVRRKF